MCPIAVAVEQPKVERAANWRWFPPDFEMTNASEVLFLACILSTSGLKADDTKNWSSAAIRAADGAGEATGGPDGAEWRFVRGQPGRMIKPLYDSYSGSVWGHDRLESIAIAMQAFDGPGRVDGLKVANLRYHWQAMPSAPKPAKWKKQEGPVRAFVFPTLIAVARLLKAHGATIRKALKLDVTQEELPTMAEQLAESRARTAELERRLPQLVLERDQARDAQRKATGRSQGVRQKASDARKAKEGSLRAKLREEKKAHTAKQKAALLDRTRAMKENVTQQLEARFEERFEAQRTWVNTACARAREAESGQAKAERKLRRVEAKAERERQAAEAAGESSDEGEEAPSPLPFEIKPRKDERGRFQAEADELHAIRLA